MPPSAAPEWLRVGWSFEITATSAPASCASMAARIPAQPAPTTRTSWVALTGRDGIATTGGDGREALGRALAADRREREPGLGEQGGEQRQQERRGDAE